MTAGATVVSQSWQTLDWFEQRATTVLRTAIAQRDDLNRLGVEFSIEMTADGRGRLERSRPEEDHIVAAAAKIRPLILERDPVYHGKVMNALGFLAQQAPEPEREKIAGLRKAWQTITTQVRWYLIVGDVAGTWQSQRMSDRDIAMNWLYADVIHATAENQKAIAHISEDERLYCGLVLVRDGVVLTMNTRRLIAHLDTSGHLTARSTPGGA